LKFAITTPALRSEGCDGRVHHPGRNVEVRSLIRRSHLNAAAANTADGETIYGKLIGRGIPKRWRIKGMTLARIMHEA
jgi:hypothetical protein